MLKVSVSLNELVKVNDSLEFEYVCFSDLLFRDARAHGDQCLLCPSHHTRPLGAEVHEQMSRSGGQSEARLPVFKSPSKPGTHLSIHCSRDERLSRPFPIRE
ncbi:uncharacterized protein TNCV_3785931 [Trichonephila clavipes]|nr:uncharacterized protein TNCV_3785931 [Trichonephila clavipes]